MRNLTILILGLLATSGVFAQDAELTNNHGGISTTWGVGDGSDKGTAYMEEYYFHDKLTFDQKQVWIRDNTAISFGHNERNCGSTGGRNRTVIGANGVDGTPNSGDEGQVRFVVDEIWRRTKEWAPGFAGTKPVHAAYTAPFTLASLTFDTGHPVVGTTGAHPTAAMSDTANFYWRGIVDSVGDEWHVLRYGDDDRLLGSTFDDAWASDGKHVMLCVNPKTPAMTVRVSGDGQFYTTPAWTYWTHKIHDQTTYLQVGTGNVTFELRNIYGANISYRINGGATVNVGAATVTLNAADFSNGSNSLEYWYTATSGTKRTRTVVKNPTHPGLAEGHGNRLWGDAGWAAFQSRIIRAPYSGLLTSAQNRGNSINQNGQSAWESTRRTGKRIGASGVWPIKSGPSHINAIVAKHLGWTAIASGAPRSYAAYAKEMLMESSLNNSYTGIEMPNWASSALPCPDTVYRGYWDGDAVYNALITYDVLMGGFRSDQQAGGITPIEDYFLRDRFAEWTHHTLAYGGGTGGMWGPPRSLAGALSAVIMPSYSTPYYGTSGVNGSTTTYAWAPYRITNYTWRSMLLTNDYTVGAYPDAPSAPFEFVQGMTTTSQGHVVGPPTLPVESGQVRVWRDRLFYASWSQMSHNIALYAVLWKAYFPGEAKPDLENFIAQITSGVLYGSKGSGAEISNPTRQPFIWCLNSNFPQAVTNAMSWMKSLASSDNNSESKQISDAGILTAFFYDDTATGGAGDTTAPTPNPATISGTPTKTPNSITVTPTTPTDETNIGSFPCEVSKDGGSTWTSHLPIAPYTFTSLPASTAYLITVRFRDAAGNVTAQSTSVLVTTDAGGVAPTAPSGLSASAVSSSQINVSWLDNSSDETAFEVERSANGSTGWVIVAATAADVTSYTDSGLMPYTTYFHRVRAVNGLGGSSYSPSANATTQAAPPASPPRANLRRNGLAI